MEVGREKIRRCSGQPAIGQAPLEGKEGWLGASSNWGLLGLDFGARWGEGASKREGRRDGQLLCTAYGVPDLTAWQPPHNLAFPSNQNAMDGKFVCTEAKGVTLDP